MQSDQHFKDACARMLVSSDGKMLKSSWEDNIILSETEFEFTVRAHFSYLIKEYPVDVSTTKTKLSDTRSAKKVMP